MHITDICWIKSSLMSHSNVIFPVLKQCEVHNFERNKIILLIFYPPFKVQMPTAENFVVIRKFLLYKTNYHDLL